MKYDDKIIYSDKELEKTLEQYAKDPSSLEYESFLADRHSNPEGGRKKPVLCKYKKPSVVDEKRIVKCFYKRTIAKSQCSNCIYESFASFYLNEEALNGLNAYVPIDYELPSIPGKKRNVDLVLRGSDGIVYFVEVKPIDSNETLLRMILEIVTYTKLLDIDREKYDEYRECLVRLGINENAPFQRAIMFFEGSKQENEYNEINKSLESKKAVNYRKIIERDGISIFMAKIVASGGYAIERLERHCTQK